jgi:hypothetical protein
MKKIILYLLLSVFLVVMVCAEDCTVAGDFNSTSYCDFDLAVKAKAALNQACLNDYECLSGVCQSGLCRSQDYASLAAIFASSITNPADFEAFLSTITAPAPTCSDGIQNQGELGVDCGGPCTACSTSGSSATGDDDDEDDDEDDDDDSSDYVDSYSGSCIEDWDYTDWSACIGNTKTRTVTDLNDCQNTVPIVPKPAATMSCTAASLTTPTCSDGIQNQGEQSVDCGGPCTPCKTCFDQQVNCHDGLCETEVDCGGPCIPCVVEEASKSKSFWIIFGTIMLMIVLGLVVYWYFTFKKDEKLVDKEVYKMSHPRHPRHPPQTPSSMLRI